MMAAHTERCRQTETAMVSVDCVTDRDRDRDLRIK